jgi:hypothetical protein
LAGKDGAHHDEQSRPGRRGAAPDPRKPRVKGPRLQVYYQHSIVYKFLPTFLKKKNLKREKNDFQREKKNLEEDLYSRSKSGRRPDPARRQ